MASAAKELCFLIQNYKLIIKEKLPNIIASSTTSNEIIDKILDVLGLSQNQKQQLKNDNIIEQSTICSNSSDVSQINIFDNSECAKIFGCIRRSNYNNNRTNFYNQMKTMGYTDKQALDEFAYLDSVCTFEGTQTNNANIFQSCIINETANMLKLDTFNPIVMAIYESLLEKDNNIPINCNLLPIDLTSEAYVKIIDSCINHVGLAQKNVAICTSNFSQSNTANIFQQCKINITPKDEPNIIPKEPISDEPKPQEPIIDPIQPPIKPIQNSEENYILYFGIGFIVVLLLIIYLIK